LVGVACLGVEAAFGRVCLGVQEDVVANVGGIVGVVVVEVSS